VKDSGQAIPLVVESCIRYINLYGKLAQEYQQELSAVEIKYS